MINILLLFGVLCIITAEVEESKIKKLLRSSKPKKVTKLNGLIVSSYDNTRFSKNKSPKPKKLGYEVNIQFTKENGEVEDFTTDELEAHKRLMVGNSYCFIKKEFECKGKTHAYYQLDDNNHANLFIYDLYYNAVLYLIGVFSGLLAFGLLLCQKIL